MIKLLSIICLVLAIVLFPPAALALVSNNAVPGDATYPIKRALEVAIQPTPVAVSSSAPTPTPPSNGGQTSCDSISDPIQKARCQLGQIQNNLGTQSLNAPAAASRRKSGEKKSDKNEEKKESKKEDKDKQESGESGKSKSNMINAKNL